MRTLIALLGAAAVAVAQSPLPVRTPRAPFATPDVKGAPAPVVKQDALMPRLPRVPTDLPDRPGTKAGPVAPHAVPDFLVIDEPGDGAVYAATPTWKVRLGSDGMKFAPYLGADADGRAVVELGTPQVTLAGEPVAVGAAVPQRRGDVVTLARGAFTERYDVRAGGVEQSFVFDTLPQRGELCVRIPLRTPLHVEATAAALVCTGERGGVRIADAVAIDADGARVPLALQYADAMLSLTVPAAFVATAHLPLVVDPTTSAIVFIADPVRLERPDIAYDPTLAEYFAVWQRDFSALDRDVYAWRLDAGTNSIGAMQAIDVSFSSWEYARVANCDLADNFLTVAQVSYAGGATWIGGRLMSPTSTGLQFVIEQAGVPGHLGGNKLYPDVGGDPSPVGPVWYTVVWERVWTASDHDVHMKQVDTNGVLRSASPTTLENTIVNTSHPRISKSDGRDAGTSSQFWGVVWQRTFSPTDEDIYGTYVSWDGQPLATGTFAVSIHSGDEHDPVVSSPTDEAGGTRHLLFAWSRYDTGTDWDIIAAYHAANGFQRGVLNVNVGEGLPIWALAPQTQPCVDCDGLRFAVGYTTDFATGTHRDTAAALVAWDDNANALVVDEPHVQFGLTYGEEEHMAIVAQGAAGGSSIYYGAIYDLYDVFGVYGIASHPYTGYADQPLPTTRLTGCGTLGITLNDLPLLGHDITFTQTDSGPLTGFVFGFPYSLLLPFCPGCELGVDGFLTTNPLTWSVPPNPTFVGFAISCQAFSLLGGPCLSQISLSNTIDFYLL